MTDQNTKLRTYEPLTTLPFRGNTIVFVKCPFTMPRDELLKNLGGLCNIGGKTVEVVGIESFCIHTIPEGMEIGLLVEGRHTMESLKEN